MQTTRIHFYLYQGGHRVSCGILFLLMLAVPSMVAGACVEDVSGQLAALKHHGEALAFYLSPHSPDADLRKHFQSIQRHNHSGPPYFYLSKSGHDRFCVDCENEPGNLFVINLGSRNESGERVRSNRLQPGARTANTLPPDTDKIVVDIFFDGSLDGSGEKNWPSYRHACGMQTVGAYVGNQFMDQVLAVALEVRIPGSGETSEGMILLVDIRDPLSPKNLFELPLEHSAGAVALTQLEDGRFLMVVGGPDSNLTLKIYKSNATSLFDTDLHFEFMGDWQPELIDVTDSGVPVFQPTWTTGARGFQTLNFVRQCDGELYLLGTHATSSLPGTGEDHAKLYKVLHNANQFDLEFVRDKHLFCNISEVTLLCDFRAAGGAYVSPAGELIIYGTEHEDRLFRFADGTVHDIGLVRMGEFRHHDTYRPDSPARMPSADAGGPYVIAEGSLETLSGHGTPALAEPWAELYDDTSFADRSVVLDWSDRHLEDWHDLDELENFAGGGIGPFDSAASSVRWEAPFGCSVALYSGTAFTGTRLELAGSDAVQEIANLDNHDFGDRTQSVRFEGNCAPFETLAFSWDLDGDGIFGETDTAAGHGDEAGGTVTFATDDLDGPGQLLVSLRVTSSNGSTDDVAAIDIVNAAPTASFTNTSGDIIEREEAILAFTDQQDPSLADTAAGFLYAYDCTNDGPFEIDASPVAESACYFPVAGTVTARGRITDKDGGYSEYTTLITVLSPREAIIRLMDTVESLNLHQGIDNALDAKLQAALQALDDLGDNDFAAAINTLQAFINHVEAQRNKKLTSEQADILVAAAQRIINSLAAA